MQIVSWMPRSWSSLMVNGPALVNNIHQWSLIERMSWMFDSKTIYSHLGDCIIRSRCQRQKKMMKSSVLQFGSFQFQKMYCFQKFNKSQRSKKELQNTMVNSEFDANCYILVKGGEYGTWWFVGLSRMFRRLRQEHPDPSCRSPRFKASTVDFVLAHSSNTKHAT